MRSLSSLGLGLGVIFGFLLVVLAAMLYYLLWWKRRITKTELFYMFCWKKPSSRCSSSLRQSQELCSSSRTTDSLVHHELDSDPNLNTGKDFFFKPVGDDPLETEMMRLNSISGPGRFLFTIVEETKEDLESEDGKSRSLSDLIMNMETPYLTPLSSPFFTPPLTPFMNTNHCQNRFNHLLEPTADSEFSKLRSSSSSSSSPPPKFKFLQDAEEKLLRKVQREESQAKLHKNDGFPPDYGENATGPKFLQDDEEEDGPFITIIVDRTRETQINHQILSVSSQVLPLPSSPSMFMSAADKGKSHFPLS